MRRRAHIDQIGLPLVLVAGLFLSTAGCGSSESEPGVSPGKVKSDSGVAGVCSPGDTRECVGPAACKGGQVCGADKVWSGCDCGAGTDASVDGTSDAGEAGVDAPVEAEAGDPAWEDDFCPQAEGLTISGDDTCNYYAPAGVCTADGDHPMITPITDSSFPAGKDPCIQVRTPSHPGRTSSCAKSLCSGPGTIAKISIPFAYPSINALNDWGICVISSKYAYLVEQKPEDMASWRITWTGRSWKDTQACAFEGMPRTSNRLFVNQTDVTIDIETDNPEAPARTFTLCYRLKDKCK